MNKFCPNCGKENPENAAFCAGCGASFAPQQQAAPQQMNPGMATPMGAPMGAPMLAERNLVLAIILSLVTCGIYSIYWFIVMTDEANTVSGEQGTSGVLAFVFTLITCGIYGFYWYYKMGQKLYQAGQRTGRQINDNSILYLILGIFGFGIINYALIQSDLNKFAK